MNGPRWQYLDRYPRPERSRAAPPAASPAVPVTVPPAPAGHPELARARGYYHLRQHAACAEVLTALLAAEPRVPGARGLLGCCLGLTGEDAAAIPHLEAARVEEPEDPDLWSMLVSAQLRAGLPPAPEPAALQGAALEIAGAAAWMEGQRRVRQGEPAEAVRHFRRASELLLGAASEEQLAPRLAACMVAESVSHLLAGHLEAAQQVFARAPGAPGGRPVRAPLQEFARQLFEVAEAARALPESERRAALAPLAALLLAVRLRVGFYVPGHPLSLAWDGLP